MEDDFDSWLAGREKEAPPGGDGLPPGTIVGDYKIVALLGRGGFAEVYRADGPNGEAVAIKILHKLDDKSRARFARESEILSQIKHRNIPRLMSFGSCGNRPYMVTELLKGYELPSSDRAIAKFLTEIMSAVEELHRRGFVHRDIKPSNILSRDDGTPVLVDFGLATPISTEQRNREDISIEAGKRVGVGTPGYSAPEQFTSGDATEASDIHALGMLINECFRWNPPASWSHLVERSTCSIKSRRYQSIKEIMAAIGDASDTRPMAALVAELLSIPLLVVWGAGCAYFMIIAMMEKIKLPGIISICGAGVFAFLALVEFGLRRRKNWARCCVIVLGFIWIFPYLSALLRRIADNADGIYSTSLTIPSILVVSHTIPAVLLLRADVRRWFKTAIHRGD